MSSISGAVRHAGAPDVWGWGSPNDPKCFDPEAHPVAIYNRLRARPFSFAGRVGHWIGGELQCATITRRGIALHALTEWPDQVGRPIGRQPTSFGSSITASEMAF
jgi:hypothetical protein